MESDFEVERIISISLHWGVAISKAMISHHCLLSACLSEFAFFLLLLLRFSTRQPRLAESSQEKLILCSVDWLWGGRTVKSEHFVGG